MNKEYNLKNIEPLWLKNFNEAKPISLIDNISLKVISDLSDKSSKFLEITLKNKLESLGYYFHDDDFYNFIKNRVTKICPDLISSVYEFVLDFDEKNKTGIFLLGIIEKQILSDLHNNRISASINFESYSKSKILKSV